MSITAKFVDKAHHFILRQLNPFDISLKLKGTNGASSTLRNSCGFPCQNRVRKTFPGTSYFHSNDGVILLCHSLVNLYIWLTI